MMNVVLQSRIETETPAERWHQPREMVEKLVAERQEMLVRYCRVAGLKPFQPSKPIQDLLREFCQILVDYIAFGHFELYHCVTGAKRGHGRSVRLAEQIYPQLAATTDVVLAFNDMYDADQDEQLLGSLANDLSNLGEELATRIELEDRLITAILEEEQSAATPGGVSRPADHALYRVAT